MRICGRELSGLNAALEAFAGVYRTTNGSKPRRTISTKGRAPNCRRSKSSLGEGKGCCRDAQGADNVSIGPTKDRRSTAAIAQLAKSGDYTH